MRSRKAMLEYALWMVARKCLRLYTLHILHMHAIDDEGRKNMHKLAENEWILWNLTSFYFSHHFFSAPFGSCVVFCVVCCRSRRQNTNNFKYIAFSLWRRATSTRVACILCAFFYFQKSLSRFFHFCRTNHTTTNILRQFLENSLSSTHTPTQEHHTHEHQLPTGNVDYSVFRT